MRHLLLVFVTCLATGCGVPVRSTDPIDRKVSSLIEETMQAGSEEQAFAGLEAMGTEAVPYIVRHLGDARDLPVKHIALVNHAVDAFEGQRQYSPRVVHDALSAILNQITGQHFEFVYNGSSPEQRRSDTAQWRQWCINAYPAKASVCSA